MSDLSPENNVNDELVNDPPFDQDSTETVLSQQDTSSSEDFRPEINQQRGSTQTEPVNSEVTPDKSVSKKKSPLLAMLAIILFLGVAFVGAWYLLKPGTDSSPVSKTQELADIALLKIGTIEGPANQLFPAETSTGINVTANNQIYEGLVEIKNDKYVPLLAESWTNPDQLTWVFKLKPNVAFHTGNVMKAEDVKASIEDQATNEFWGSFVSTIASTEVSGDLEVTIKTTNPDPLLLNRLSKTYIRDLSGEPKVGMNGTGAYLLNNDAENSESKMNLIAFEKYHAGTPKTKALEFIVFDDDAKVSDALKNKEVDLIDQSPGIDELLSQDLDSYTKITFDSAGSNGIYLNLLKKDSPLSNLKVRQALLYAIDRQALVDKLDDSGIVPVFQMVPKTLSGYDNSLVEVKSNNDTVKKLLTEAGYPDGVTLEFIYFEGAQTEPPILIEQLREAGFTIKSTGYTTPDEMFGAVENKNFDMFTSTYTSDISDARDIFGSVSVNENPVFAAVDDKAFDDLLEASDTEFDPIKRTEALQKVNKYIYDNVLWIPIRNSRYSTYFRKNILIQPRSATEFTSIKYFEVGEIVNN